MNIARFSKPLAAAGLLVIAAAALIVAFNGLNLGIDFRGGTLLERGLPGVVTADEVREALADPSLAELDLGRSVIQPLEESGARETVMLIRTPALEGTEGVEAIDAVLEARFGGVSVRRTEMVGPVIGRELVGRALLALALAAVGMLVYVSLRFEYRFALAAVVALVHDVFLVLAVVSLAGIEVTSAFVAAMLTLVGYSINATIVVFDRVRENLSLRKGSLDEIVNLSVRQSLARCINTSLTTLFVVGSLYFFGGSTIKDLTLTLLVGIVAGTYSSIFFASSMWLVLRRMTGAAKAAVAS